MVVVKIKGGLGNQLFQYAAARAVAHRNTVPLKFDLTRFRHDPLRAYRLDRFNIVGTRATEEQVALLRGDGRSGLQRRLWMYIQDRLPYHRRRIVAERQFHFDSALLQVRSPVYMAGYWQSERYFEDIDDLLRSELTLRVPPDPVNELQLQHIRAVDAVSIHVRRGDYANDPHTSRQHGVCSLAYYRDAVARVCRDVAKPHFLVFSDDMDWACENLRFVEPVTFVDHNGPENDFEDLRLMAACTHHIIANSSFSWWGAWLGQHQAQIVIAPRLWFNARDEDTSDLLPPSWIRI